MVLLLYFKASCLEGNNLAIAIVLAFNLELERLLLKKCELHVIPTPLGSYNHMLSDWLVHIGLRRRKRTNILRDKLGRSDLQ